MFGKPEEKESWKKKNVVCLKALVFFRDVSHKITKRKIFTKDHTGSFGMIARYNTERILDRQWRNLFG